MTLRFRDWKMNSFNWKLWTPAHGLVIPTPVLRLRLSLQLYFVTVVFVVNLFLWQCGCTIFICDYLSTPICFLVGKLHMHPLGFEPHNPTLHPFLWEKEVPFELVFIVNVSFIFLSLVGDGRIATDDTCISWVLL